MISESERTPDKFKDKMITHKQKIWNSTIA